MNLQFRQGDVLITRVDGELPTGLELVARDQGRVVLAYGESTGHAHAIAERAADLFARPGTDERWLVIRASGTTVESSAVLRHEEHGALTLASGIYRVTRQREYSPEAIRNVMD